MVKKAPKKTGKKTAAPAAKKAKTAVNKKAKPPKSAPKKASNKKTVEKKTAKVVKKKQAPKSVKQTVSKPPMTQINLKEMIMNMNSTKNFEKMSQDAANISKETMEACQKSASILAKNSQDCVTTYMAMMQSAAEKQNKLMKEMLGKKTINEMSETLQSASQESFNDMMENMSKLSEQSIKAVMDCYEPLNSQMNKVVKKASNAA